MIAKAVFSFCFFFGALTASSLPQLDVYQSIQEMVDKRDGNVGKQVVLDLYDCQCPHLDNLEWVQAKMIEAAHRAKGHVVESSFHKFKPYGISGVVVIEESHIAIHIWPQSNYAAVDIFTCSDVLGVKEAANFLIDAFQSKRPAEFALTRGKGISNDIPEGSVPLKLQ